MTFLHRATSGAVTRLAAVALAACFAGCSSGAQLPPSTASPAAASEAGAAPGSRHKGASLTVRIRIPARHRAHGARYVSPSTRGLTMVFTGASNFSTSVALTPGSPGCTGVPLVCTASVALAPGAYTLAADALDEAPAGGVVPPGAHVLSTAAGIALTVRSGQNNDFGIVLDGVPATIVIGGFPDAYPGTAFSGEPFAVTALDADGNAIVGTYSSPIVLSDGDTSGTTSIATGGADAPPNGTLFGSSDTPTIAFTGATIPGAIVTGTSRSASGYGYFGVHMPIYVVDQINQVVDTMQDDCTSASCVNVNAIGGGFGLPGGVAVDAAGNAYVTDGDFASILKVPKGCTASACVVALGGGFNANGNDAVGPANAIIATDFGHQAVKSVPAGCTSASCVTAIGGSFPGPVGVAVDSAGDVFVADQSASVVSKIPPGCTSSACVTTIGGGFQSPEAVAVDLAGNVLVDDYGNSAVKKIPPGCTSASCVMAIGGGFSYPMGLAVDGFGDAIVGDTGNGRVEKVPPTCFSSACVVTLGGGWGSVLDVAVY
jgi:hypothetical protein